MLISLARGGIWGIIALSPTSACEQVTLSEELLPTIASPVEFSSTWHTLGPFRIGTREAVWGADPLEALGGFRNLGYNASVEYRSPLGVGALVQWKTLYTSVTSFGNSSTASIELGYPYLDWESAQQVYGWASQQWQAWGRGIIWNHDSIPTKIVLSTSGILEYWLNDEHVFGGDFYGFDRAPFVVQLQPGSNILSLRFVRDVRAMGGIGAPTVAIKLSATRVSSQVAVVHRNIIMPDLIDGSLTSNFISIPICNHADHPVQIRRCQHDMEITEYDFVQPHSVRLQPGQTRYVALRLKSLLVKSGEIPLVLCHSSEERLGELGMEKKLHFVLRPNTRALYAAQKFTFLHPTGAVSHAVVRPPSQNVVREHYSELAIMVNLHGAGVEVDSDQARHAFDQVPDLKAWVLFPSGMSPWCGDDCHNVGFADIMAAIAALPAWIDTMRWSGPGVDTNRILVSGHSNGGQGAWYFVTHQPDRIIAAAPVSGYTSIENYVPFSMWTEAEPLQDAILLATRSDFRHEILLDNIADVPLLQQHGSADVNVPPYHSRLMSFLRAQKNLSADYVELADEGHWFDGVMTTSALRQFYAQHLPPRYVRRALPKYFTIISPNTANLGTIGGIHIDQLESPDNLGRMQVYRGNEEVNRIWTLKPRNIHRFTLDLTGIRSDDKPSKLLINEGDRNIFAINHSTRTTFVKRSPDDWEVETGARWWSKERSGDQRGTLDAILRSNGSLCISYDGPGSERTALEISRNMVQYFGLDSEITKVSQRNSIDRACVGNHIRVHSDTRVSPTLPNNFPIQFHNDSVTIRRHDGSFSRYDILDVLAMIVILPYNSGRLDLLIWGKDQDGLRQASRLSPTLTGAGQPDFVLFGNEAPWLGHAGSLAMGFFDYRWNVSRASYVP